VAVVTSSKLRETDQQQEAGDRIFGGREQPTEQSDVLGDDVGSSNLWSDCADVEQKIRRPGVLDDFSARRLPGKFLNIQCYYTCD